MKEKSYSANDLRSARSDPSGSRSGFKLGAKLRARMKNLEEWRISPSSIKAPRGAREYHGGHATVSKAFLPDRIDYSDPRVYRWKAPKSYKPREYMQLCRQSSESRVHIRGAADEPRDAEGELGDEEKDDEGEHGSDSDLRWLGQFVAVKKSRIGDNKDPERVLGLALRETEFLVELSHPNIVELKGFVEDLSKDIIWLVLPWADNGNLKDFVASRDWEIPERISLINDVASGLEYLHRQEPPVCHGDLKSYNILVNSEHRAVVTDFGSARHLTEHDLNRQPGLVQNQQQPVQAIFSTLSKTITLTGNIYTLRWAAPELLNDDQISLGSDIWALGWIAYEVLTNSIPFQNVPADAVVVERVIKGDLPSIDEHGRVSLFKELCTIVTMCWNSNPSKRPTAKDYLRAVSDMPMVIPDPTESFFASSSVVLMWRGRRALTFGDLGMAFACFTEAHVIYTRIDNKEGRADALWGLAEVHQLRGEYSEALVHYSKTLQIRTEIRDTPGQASALSSIDQVHQLRKEYNEAIKLSPEALQIRPDINDRIGQASALSSLAEVHQLRGEYSKAIKLYSEALQIRTEIGDRPGQASALSSMAQVHQLREEYGEALVYYSKALQIRTEVGDRPGQASNLSSIAQVHQLRKEYSEIIKLYSEALQIRTEIGDRPGQASNLSSIAQVHQLRKEYSEALVHYSKALQIRTEVDDRPGQASDLSSIAQVHHLRKEYSEALVHYSKALQIHTEIGDRPGQASALSSIAQVRHLRKEYNEAIKLYPGVLQIRPDINDRMGRASALSSLAEVHQLGGEYSEIIKLYSKALQIHTEIGDRPGQASDLSSIAHLHHLRKEYSEALVHYSKALQIRPDINDSKGQASALSSLAERHQLRKGYGDALHIRSNLADLKDTADAVLNHSLTNPHKFEQAFKFLD